jgi:hypothetical protein
MAAALASFGHWSPRASREGGAARPSAFTDRLPPHTYETSFARRRPYSTSVIDPDFFS